MSESARQPPPASEPAHPKAGGRGARFSASMDEAAVAMNTSVGFDHRLLRDDVRGSQAHARMLAAVGLISNEDAEAIVAGLDRVAQEFSEGGRVSRQRRQFVGRRRL